MDNAASVYGDRGVWADDHPVVRMGGTLTAAAITAAPKAGTILKANGANVEPAATADTPVGVLAADSDGTANVIYGVHGVVVSKRLLDNTGAEANATLKAKLAAIGIYLKQAWTGDFK
jgi:hypothetical protein